MSVAVCRAEDTPLVQQLSQEVFQIGAVRLDKRTRTVTFPATVNMVEGLVEYFAVSETGKTHESILVSKAEPYHVHLAMLLLGVHATASAESAPPAQIDAQSLKNARELPGENIEIFVAWTKENQPQGARAEEWIVNSQQKAPGKNGPWRYTGSLVSNGSFLAQVEGSMIALVTDPSALINNPRAGHNDDTIWVARSEKLPPAGTPVEITIALPPQKKTP